MKECIGRTVLTDCTVRTAASMGSAHAIAIDGKAISDIGDRALQKPKDWLRISLEGRTVLPGLIDAHVHLTGSAAARLRLNLENCMSLEEVMERVAGWVKEHPGRDWILGAGWDDSLWDDRFFPSLTMLDDVVGDRPTFLTRRDRHSAWLNSAAMERLGPGVSASQDLLPKDQNGRLTGIVRETLLDEFSAELPPVDEERLLDALIKEQEHLWSLGIVGVHTMERSNGLRILGRLASRGQLGLKTYLAAEGVAAQELKERVFDICPQGFKLFADGSLGSGTAWMIEPGSSETSGLAITVGAELDAQIRLALDLGLDLCVHAIGDRAVREVLDVFTPYYKQYPSRKFRIEHAQHIDADDMERVGIGNLALSVQPCHLLSDVRLLEDVSSSGNRLDYAYRTMINRGATLLMGTDLPIEPADPWRNISAAMERCEEGGRPWSPGERLDFEDVLLAYTSAPAEAAGWSKSGTLTPGKEASFVVVERDPASGPPWGQKVVLTVSKGEVLFSDGTLHLE